MAKRSGSINYTRDNLFKEVRFVKETGQPYTITKNGVPVVTMISANIYKKLERLLEAANNFAEENKLQEQTVIDRLAGSINLKGKKNIAPDQEEPEAHDEKIRQEEHLYTEAI